MSKICTACGEEKPRTEFQKCARNKDGLTGLCLPCKRAYDNAYYKNKSGRKEQITSNRRRAEIETRRYVWTYLESNPCVDCGETDPVVLEFDHIDRSDKVGDIAALQRSSLKAVVAEIEKCQVRCANCHRRKTAEQLGWYNWREPSGS